MATPSTPAPMSEGSYVRELQRNLRNVTKKMAAMAKVDAIISENPTLTLDELVATRKINNDQKAQALKKPALQIQVAQLEEQLTQYKKFEDEISSQLQTKLEEAQRIHQEELDAARKFVGQEAAQSNRATLRKNLLTVSSFLKTAAQRRMEEAEDLPESRAFESVLSLLYGGDVSAVDAMENLMNGSSEPVVSTDGEPLSVNYATVKQLSVARESEAQNGEHVASDVRDIASPAVAAGQPATDPTIAYAGLTELTQKEDDPSIPVTNGDIPDSVPSVLHISAPGSTDDVAANAAGSTSATAADEIAQDWVSVPRDKGETDEAPPSAANNATTNWADDISSNAQVTPVSAPAATDGFREVHHRGGARGRGSRDREGGRSRGGRGHHRGDHRGGRGGGGRGRGRFRGEA